MTGYPDLPPVRVGIALGDMVAGLYAVIGTLMSLRARDEDPEKKGQVVDVATSTNLSLVYLKAYITRIRNCSGSYRELDKDYLARNCPIKYVYVRRWNACSYWWKRRSIFERLMTAIGKEDIAFDPKYGNESRASRQCRISRCDN